MDRFLRWYLRHFKMALEEQARWRAAYLLPLFPVFCTLGVIWLFLWIAQGMKH